MPEALIGLQDTLGLSTAVIVSDLLLEWVPDAATRKRILVDNACALYGFPLPS